MTRAGRFDDRLGAGLSELADPRFPDYYDDVLTVTSRTRQRPAWTFPGRWIPMVDIARRRTFVPALPWRGLSLLVALVVLASLAVLITVGSQKHLPAPFGPARNGLITYDRAGDLYVGDPAGPSRLLLGGPETDVDPSYSRTGTLISFLRHEADYDTDSIWSIAPDGGHLTRLTPPVQTLTSWDWGATDQSILYVSLEGALTQLHRVPADGSAPPTLIAPELAISGFSVRPPDGRTVAVRGVTGQRAGIYLIDLATGEHRLLKESTATLEEHDMADLRYSPDGTKIAYGHWDPDGNMRLHVMNADGSADRVLHWGDATWEAWPIWSPDSQRIVFQRAFATASTHMQFGHPFVIVNADGTGQPTEFGPPLEAGVVQAEFSPDGTVLLMRTIDSGTQLMLDPRGGPGTPVPWQSTSYPSWQRLAQ